MKAVNSLRPVGGDRSNVTYATINQQSAASLRVPVPAGFQNGSVATNPDGSTFIPFTADLPRRRATTCRPSSGST